jgi:diaminopimelate epimerase
MLFIAKAHAYGNDFLFIPHDQAEGHDPHVLAQRTCARHTGVGGDGLIFYSVAPDGTARMRLYNADGSPSELSGNGLRCLAALVLHLDQRRPADQAGLTEVQVDTDAGWKALRLVARAGKHYTLTRSVWLLFTIFRTRRDSIVLALRSPLTGAFQPGQTSSSQRLMRPITSAS